MGDLPEIPQQVAPAYNLQGQAQDLASKDVYTMLQPILSVGYIWSGDTNSLIRPGTRTLVADTPWVHTKGTPLNHCALDHYVMFNLYGIIPPRCMNCWKVVVSPNNFAQLMELEQIQLGLNVPSKCGIELRHYTPRHYGGYFYTRSRKQGLDRYKQVRALVDMMITDGKDVGIILKRGCTEYEMAKGPSHLWKLTPEDQAKVELIESYVDLSRGDISQPDFIKDHVRLKWMLWAHSNNDPSYIPFNGGEPLFPSCVTYHDGDPDEEEERSETKIIDELDVPKELQGEHDELT